MELRNSISLLFMQDSGADLLGDPGSNCVTSSVFCKSVRLSVCLFVTTMTALPWLPVRQFEISDICP